MEISSYVYYCAELDKLIIMRILFKCGFCLCTGSEVYAYDCVYIGEL